jgi:hypothetical protein
LMAKAPQNRPRDVREVSSLLERLAENPLRNATGTG